MDWALLSPSATANAAVWSGSVQRLLDAGVRACLSVYHRRHAPERLLLTGLHAHAGVISVEGCHPNPYQLPPEVAASTAAAASAVSIAASSCVTGTGRENRYPWA